VIAGVSSNLDRYDHVCALDCPCLLAVWWEPIDERTTGGQYFHDADVARVLRAERGHP
jgi:hypothetical protein